MSVIKHMSFFSLKKFFGPHLTRHDFHFVGSWSKREECWWDGAGSAPEVQGSWVDVQQSREGPGNLWAPTPRADIWSASSLWGGWFSFAPHLFPIKSYKTPIKMVTKQKFSQVQLDWNFLYQFCHLQRLPHTQGRGGKCGLIHPGGPGNAFVSCSYEMRAVVIPGCSALK